MALRDCCDAYGTPKDVNRYTILLLRGGTSPYGSQVLKRSVSLSPRGLARAQGLIERAVSAASRTPVDEARKVAESQPKPEGETNAE
jgi:hypothetical protein